MCKGLADYLDARAEVYSMLADELSEAAAVAAEWEDESLDYDLDVDVEDLDCAPVDEAMDWFGTAEGKAALRSYGYDPDSDPAAWPVIGQEVDVSAWTGRGGVMGEDGPTGKDARGPNA